MQPNLETGEITPKMVAAKNKAVGNWYALLTALGNNVTSTGLNSNGTTASLSSTAPSSTNANVITVGHSTVNFALLLAAGTDTTTATTSNMGNLATPLAYNAGLYANTTLYPTTNVNASSVQWSGTWNANAFGGSPVTLGEFGIGLGSVGVSDAGTFALLRRLSVADGSFSPLLVNNTLPLTVTVVVSND